MSDTALMRRIENAAALLAVRLADDDFALRLVERQHPELTRFTNRQLAAALAMAAVELAAKFEDEEVSA